MCHFEQHSALETCPSPGENLKTQNLGWILYHTIGTYYLEQEPILINNKFSSSLSFLLVLKNNYSFI